MSTNMKKYLPFVVVIAVVAAIVIIFAMKDDDNNNETTSPTPPPTAQTEPTTPANNPTPPPTPPASSTNNKVSIVNMNFSPASITVKKGTTVTWTNNDSVTHTVTRDSGDDGPDSGDIPPGESFTFTFNDEGMFPYHCIPHPQMTGTVTVTE